MHPFIAPPRLHGTLYSPEELVRYCQLTLPEDSRGFELLVSQYKGLVFKTVFRLMGNRDDAGDQAQEVFVKIYRGIKQIDVPLTFPTWIYCITVITCLDALRKKSGIRYNRLNLQRTTQRTKQAQSKFQTLARQRP